MEITHAVLGNYKAGLLQDFTTESKNKGIENDMIEIALRYKLNKNFYDNEIWNFKASDHELKSKIPFNGSVKKIIIKELLEENNSAIDFVNNTKIRVPKKYQPFLKLLEYDSEGYWCYSRKGYIFKETECHTAHEYTQADILKSIRNIEKDG